MQSWQVLALVLVVVVFGISFAMRGKLRGRAAALYGGAMTAFRSEVAAGHRVDEGDPILLVAMHRKLLSAKMYYVAVTRRRVVLMQVGGETQTFDRGSVKLAIKEKTFADVGNMQTTYSSGWELSVGLPDGQRHAWRVYEHAEGIEDHGAHVRALASSLAS